MVVVVVIIVASQIYYFLKRISFLVRNFIDSIVIAIKVKS